MRSVNSEIVEPDTNDGGVTFQRWRAALWKQLKTLVPDDKTTVEHVEHTSQPGPRLRTRREQKLRRSQAHQYAKAAASPLGWTWETWGLDPVDFHPEQKKQMQQLDKRLLELLADEKDDRFRSTNQKLRRAERNEYWNDKQYEQSLWYGTMKEALAGSLRRQLPLGLDALVLE